MSTSMISRCDILWQHSNTIFMFELRRSHPSLLFISSLGRHRPWSIRLQISLLITKVLPPISVINFLDIVVTIMVREYKATRFTAPSASLFTVNDLRQGQILLLWWSGFYYISTWLALYVGLLAAEFCISSLPFLAEQQKTQQQQQHARIRITKTKANRAHLAIVS